MDLVGELKRCQCRGESLPEDRAAMVQAPEDTEVAKIEEVMETMEDVT